jgi:tetratricopeptide (TPR) repeat protein
MKNYPQGLESINKFFGMAKPEILISSDYEYQGKLQIATGDTAKGIENVYKAAEMDTAKVGLYAAIGETFWKARQYDKAAEAYEKAMTRGTKESNVRDMVFLGLSYLYGKNYEKADTVFGQFITEYPDQYIGMYYKAQAEAAQDTDAKGTAKPYFEKYIEIVNADPEKKDKNKANLIKAYDYLAVYYLKTEKDLAKAKDSANKILEIDPNNARAKTFLQYKQSDLGGTSTGSQSQKATSAKSGAKASGGQK